MNAPPSPQKTVPVPFQPDLWHLSSMSPSRCQSPHSCQQRGECVARWVSGSGRLALSVRTQQRERSVKVPPVHFLSVQLLKIQEVTVQATATFRSTQAARLCNTLASCTNSQPPTVHTLPIVRRHTQLQPPTGLPVARQYDNESLADVSQSLRSELRLCPGVPVRRA